MPKLIGMTAQLDTQSYDKHSQLVKITPIYIYCARFDHEGRVDLKLPYIEWVTGTVSKYESVVIANGVE